MAAEPEAADASAVWDPVEQVDRRFTGTLYYPGGRTAQVSCAFDMGLGSFFEVLGTKGRMSARTAVTQDTMTIAVTTSAQGAEDTQEWTMNRPLMFAAQADSFVELFRDGTPQPNHIDDALAQARVMDAIFEAARTGRRVYVEK
jgi:predicted dehydrogenase